MMSCTVFIVQVSSVAFVVLCVIDAIRFRREVTKFAWVGLLFGLGVVLLDIAGVVGQGSLILEKIGGLKFASIEILILAKTAILVSVGMYCCDCLGLPSAPFIMKKLDLRIHRVSTQCKHDPIASDPQSIVIRQVWPPEGSEVTTEDAATDLPEWRVAMSWAVALAGAGILYSCILFLWASPQLSSGMRKLYELSAEIREEFGVDVRKFTPTWMTMVVVCAAAVGEEIVFRLGVQNLLAKNFRLTGSRYWVAILASAAFWSLAHANMLDPEWVKFAQVFPLGIALGFLFRRFGVEVCILGHGIFNVAMVFLAPKLIEF